MPISEIGNMAIILLIAIGSAVALGSGLWCLIRRWLDERFKLQAIQHEAEQIRRRQEPGFRWN